uniref:Uncharacterized protein n=1 Tax=Pithovirus LCPAC101 TaxID=2506586 RepID=A0A481Z498_9VIRU|nr:MAG: hypothetical protein LCPAC101_01120 [Pithovirus LCPAC101]
MSAESIYKTLPQDTIVDLLYAFSNEDVTRPAVIHFDPEGGYKKTRNIKKYIRDLYKFILYVYDLVENEEESIAVDMVHDSIYNGEYFEILFEQLLDIIEPLTDTNKKFKRLIESLDSLPDVLNFIIKYTDYVLKETDISTHLAHDLMFKVGLNLKESSDLLFLLDERNARRFFSVKNLPIFSLNQIVLEDNAFVLSHAVMEDSRSNYSLDNTENTVTTYIFK